MMLSLQKQMMEQKQETERLARENAALKEHVKKFVPVDADSGGSMVQTQLSATAFQQGSSQSGAVAVEQKLVNHDNRLIVMERIIQDQLGVKDSPFSPSSEPASPMQRHELFGEPLQPGTCSLSTTHSAIHLCVYIQRTRSPLPW